MAAYIGFVLFTSMAGAAVLIDLAFTAIGIVPAHSTDIRRELTTFSIDYTFWLNLAAGLLGVALFVISRGNTQSGGSHACEHCS